MYGYMCFFLYDLINEEHIFSSTVELGPFYLESGKLHINKNGSYYGQLPSFYSGMMASYKYPTTDTSHNKGFFRAVEKKPDGNYITVGRPDSPQTTMYIYEVSDVGELVNGKSDVSVLGASGYPHINIAKPIIFGDGSIGVGIRTTYNSNGNFIYKRYSADLSSSLSRRILYVSGQSRNLCDFVKANDNEFVALFEGMYFHKLNKDGVTPIWSKRITTSNVIAANLLTSRFATSDSNYLFCEESTGCFYLTTNGRLIIKLDPDFNILWAKKVTCDKAVGNNLTLRKYGDYLQFSINLNAENAFAFRIKEDDFLISFSAGTSTSNTGESYQFGLEDVLQYLTVSDIGNLVNSALNSSTLGTSTTTAGDEYSQDMWASGLYVTSTDIF